MTDYIDTLLRCAIEATDGHPSEAQALLRLLVGRCGPRDADVLSLLGQLSRQAGDLAQTQWFLSQALTVQPEHAIAHAELGEMLRAVGRPQEAIPHLERSLALDPTLSAAAVSLSATLAALDRLSEALRWAHTALDRGADAAVAHGLIGDILGRMGRSAEAISHYDRALARRPADSLRRYRRGLLRLSQGDMPAAWDDHEARLDLPGRDGFDAPLWRGQDDLNGVTILLHAEQGVADTIQFVRYAHRVAGLGANVLLQVQPGLGQLCGSARGVRQVIEAGGALPRYDRHCPIPSLPAVFGAAAETIPADVPYLEPDVAARTQWRQALGPWRKMRVGFAWSGAGIDPVHAVPLTVLGPLLARDDIECHVIQRAITVEDRAALAHHEGLSDHSKVLWDFGQAAALVSAMDLVIAADTAEAHLAGALGVPAWVMLSHTADWRWLQDRDDSPWYPTLRLFRQTQPGNWRTVLEQVARNLDAWSVPRS